MADTKVEIFQDYSGAWRFRAVAANGETIASSESYATRFGARRGGRRAFPDAELVEL